jgi:hypothetical protein
MKLISKFLKGLAVVLGILVLLVVLLANSAQLALYGSVLLGMMALLVFVWPFPPVWLGGRFVSIAILCIAVLGGAASQRVAEHQRSELAAKNEARMQDLRRSDPHAYLAELKAIGDSRWESEFQTLDKQGYEMFVAERRRNEELARNAEIAKLVEALRAVPTSDIERMLVFYDQLSTLEPTNVDYKRKRESLSKQVAEVKLKKQREAEQLANPESYVALESFSWTKEGFGNVMEATFTIKNSLPWAVKDIEIRCEHSAPSGTTVDSNTRTIYERFEANKSRQISKFGMGFIHSQATRSGCRVLSVVVLR